MTISHQFNAYPLLPLFTLQVSDRVSKPLPSGCEEMIENIWRHEFEKSEGKLFNGKLLSFVSLSHEKLIGEFVDFKFFLAQIIEPKLKPILQIEPIGVSGLTFSQGKILCGCRSSHVTTYAHWDELVPSGGVDAQFISDGRIDLQKQLSIELEEEAGIAAEHILKISPLALIHDMTAGGYDICIAMELSGSAIESTLSFSPEYEILKWVPKELLMALNEKGGNGHFRFSKESFVPLSLYLIENYLK